MFEREFQSRQDYIFPLTEGVFVWDGAYDDLRGIEDVSDDPADLIF